MKKDEGFFKRLIDNSRELICFHQPDGTYKFVSQSITKIAGYSPKDLLGKNPYDYFHPDDIKSIQEKGHKPSLKGDEKPFVEYRFKAKDGRWIWLQTLTTPILNDKKEVINLLTSSREISNLISLRQKLVNSEMLLEEASFLSQVGAWELDAETLKPTQSKALFEILEVDEDSGLSLQQSLELFPAKAKQKIEHCVSDGLSKGISWDIILPINTAKGNQIWIRSIGKPRKVKGKVVKIYGIIQDVTDHIETQKKLESVISTLTKQKNHLEDFNHIISHNLRSPVKNLSILISHLDDLNTNKQTQELIDHIKIASSSINELLEDLVDVVKVIQHQDIDVENIRISDVINKSKSILNGQIHQVCPKINIDLSAWDEIEYPRVYMESIVLNLLSNALKYSSPKKEVSIEICSFIEDNRKGFSFKDNGLGMDLEKYKNKLFKLNRTFHKNINGKGLGLYMTKKQVESMGGEISVKSKVGEGTEFKVLLEEAETE